MEQPLVRALVRRAGQQRQQALAVKRALRRCHSARDFEQGRVQVQVRSPGIGLAARFEPARPPSKEGRPHASLVDRGLAASQACAVVAADASVVAHEQNHSVLPQAGRVDEAEQAPDRRVALLDQSVDAGVVAGDAPGAVLLVQGIAHQKGRVRHVVRQIQEEWLISISANERRCRVCQDVGDVSSDADRAAIIQQRVRLPVAFRMAGREEDRLVETALIRMEAAVLSQMPFPENTGPIAGLTQRLR